MFIIKILLKWVVLAGAVVLAAHFIPGISVASWTTAFMVGLVLGIINTFIKPVLSLLTLPINFITLGFFGVILNALLFWAAAYFVSGFIVASFLAAFLGSLVIALVMAIAEIFLD